MSDIEKAKRFNVSLGYTYTLTEGGTYHAIPLGATFRPWRWLLASVSIPVSIIDAEETYDDEVLVLGVPTPRETTLDYSAAGLGDVSITAWVDAAHLLALRWAAMEAPPSAPAPGPV